MVLDKYSRKVLKPPFFSWQYTIKYMKEMSEKLQGKENKLKLRY